MKITLGEIPTNYDWLANSSLYEQFIEENFEDCDEIDFSIVCSENEPDVKKLVKVAYIWNVYYFPISTLEIISNSKENIMSIFKNLESQNDNIIDKLFIFRRYLNDHNKLILKSAFLGYLDILEWTKFKGYHHTNSAISEQIFTEVLKYGNLKSAKWMKNNGYELNVNIFINIMNNKNLRVIEWLIHNNCPWNYKVFAEASKIGDLEIMRILKQNGCPWSYSTFTNAAINGNLKNMKWLLKYDFPRDETVFYETAIRGNLENMKWLRDNNFPWNKATFTAAVINGNIENMTWLARNRCPYDKTDLLLYGNHNLRLWINDNL